MMTPAHHQSTRWPIVSLAFGLHLVGLSACAAPERPPETAVIASGTDLESGNPLVTIHPLSRQLQRNALFVTLLRLDSLLQPVPYYARSWTWNAAHTELTFSLNTGLRWHDGVPTTARDVAFTLDAVRDPSLGAPRAGDLANVQNVSVVDDSTVRVTFAEPVTKLPPVWAELPIAPRHLLDSVPRSQWRKHAYAIAPVGNGPFRFVDRIAGRRWRFVRNDSFPQSMGGPPLLAQLVVAVVDEPSTKFAGLVSGELDLAGVSPVMAHLVKQDPTLELLTPPALLSNILAFNTTRAPFDDPRVRRAVAMSVDRERLVKAAVAGYATPATTAIPPGLPVSRNTGRALRDTARADSLLDAAGWKRGGDGIRVKNGARLAITLTTVGSGDQALEQLIQADLAARGIPVTIRVAQMAAFLTELRAPRKSYDVALTAIPGDIALGHIRAMFATAQRGGALDYTGWHNETFDHLIDGAQRSQGDAAVQAWSLVDSMLLAESPVAWLYHARGVQGISRHLQGVTMDVRGELVTLTRWQRTDSLRAAPAISPRSARTP